MYAVNIIVGAVGEGGLQVVPNWHSPNLRHGNKIQTQTKSIENFVFKKTWRPTLKAWFVHIFWKDTK